MGQGWEGVKKSENFADIISGSSLRLPSKGEPNEPQTERLERRLKLLDFVCVTVFPLIFAGFNCVYWLTQYSFVARDQRSRDGGHE